MLEFACKITNINVAVNNVLKKALDHPTTHCQEMRDQDLNLGYCGHNAMHLPLYDHGRLTALVSP